MTSCLIAGRWGDGCCRGVVVAVLLQPVGS
jgi:hypothetical protein